MNTERSQDMETFNGFTARYDRSTDSYEIVNEDRKRVGTIRVNKREGWLWAFDADSSIVTSGEFSLAKTLEEFVWKTA